MYLTISEKCQMSEIKVSDVRNTSVRCQKYHLFHCRVLSLSWGPQSQALNWSVKNLLVNTLDKFFNIEIFNCLNMIVYQQRKDWLSFPNLYNEYYYIILELPIQQIIIQVFLRFLFSIILFISIHFLFYGFTIIIYLFFLLFTY